MSEPTTRRGFLALGAAASTGALIRPAAARAVLPSRVSRYRLSLAAYSMRKYLNLKNPTMTLEEFIVKCAEWGTDGTELTEYYFKKPVTPEYVMRLKRTAFAHGLDITGTPVGNRFTLPPGESRDCEVARIKKWIDLSADLGSPAIRIFAGNAPKGVDEDQARAWAVECIQACLEQASKRGVFLALENHGGVVARAEGMLAIVKAVKSEWFGVNLDTGNFRVEDPYAELERCAPHAVTCQLKTEIHRPGKKKEPVDLGRIAAILRGAGYKGYVTLEYEAAEDPVTAIPKTLEELRKIF